MSSDGVTWATTHPSLQAGLATEPFAYRGPMAVAGPMTPEHEAAARERADLVAMIRKYAREEALAVLREQRDPHNRQVKA